MPFTTKEIGQLGEDIGCKYLKSMGFSISDRNYLKKWGEIDIVASKHDKLHFIEVKTVTNSPDDFRGGGRLPLSNEGKYRPEDNVHHKKLKRMRRVIQSYLSEKRGERDWQFDILAIELNTKEKIARCRFLKDIIL